MSEDVYSLPGVLGQAIISYLAQRPYAEVVDLVVGMQKLEKVEPVPEPPEPVRAKKP